MFVSKPHDDVVGGLNVPNVCKIEFNIENVKRLLFEVDLH